MSMYKSPGKGYKWSYPIRVGVKSYGGWRYQDRMAYQDLFYSIKKNSFHLTTTIKTPDMQLKVIHSIRVMEELFRIMKTKGKKPQYLTKGEKSLLYAKAEDVIRRARENEKANK